MSVRVLDRNESKVEFLSNFHNLRREIELFLMRDFGIKKRNYDTALMEEIYQMDEEDKTEYESLMKRIGAKSSIIDKYPVWLIDSWRESIMNILDNIGIQIEIANSCYVQTAEEAIERRLAWDKAIGYLNALKDKLQDIIYCVQADITLGCYEQIVVKLKREISLIKGVRKSDYKKGFR